MNFKLISNLEPKKFFSSSVRKKINSKVNNQCKRLIVIDLKQFH